MTSAKSDEAFCTWGIANVIPDLYKISHSTFKHKGNFMLENVTYQISDTEKWWNYISLIISLLGSFAIAYFTIHLTQYIQEKKEFDTSMYWLRTEGVVLMTFLIQLKVVIDDNLRNSNIDSKTKTVELLQFPDFNLESLNFIFSKGYIRLLNEESTRILVRLKLDIIRLRYNAYFYNQLVSLVSITSTQNFNEQKITALKNLHDNIDLFLEDFEATQKIPKYPKKLFEKK